MHLISHFNKIIGILTKLESQRKQINKPNQLRTRKPKPKTMLPIKPLKQKTMKLIKPKTMNLIYKEINYTPSR